MEEDIIKTIYEELFTLKFLHSGYGDPRPDFIADNIILEPDGQTKIFFSNYNLLYRFFNDTLICFMRCADALPRVPYIKLSGDVRMRFFMNASSDFFNKTVVDVAGAQQVYQFTNQVNIGTGGFISMHTQGVNSDDLKDVAIVNPDQSCLAVIDIHNEGAVNTTYNLFSGVDQDLQSPNYSIRFISKI